MTKHPSVLIIDDDKAFREDMKVLLGTDFRVFTAVDREEAFQIINQEKIDLILLDLMLQSGESGIDILRALKEAAPIIPVIMATEYASVETAVEAMRLGAYDYVSKSPNLNELRALIEKAMAESALRREKRVLQEELAKRFGRLVGASPAMKEVFLLIEKVARTDATVLITGEHGTGKELVAREIHDRSSRSEKPFVIVNCASIVENLVESELFGHQRGAFTGAVATKLGKFELAEGGTIFLDEIAELPLHAQVRLLRVLQEHEIERVGGTKLIHVDVRVIAATNQNLPEKVKAGLFREDLFYRLNVFPIHLPPLRERTDDIPLLAQHFIERTAIRIGRPKLNITEDAIAFLQSQTWQGNVRELENTIERAAIQSDADTLTLSSFSFLSPHWAMDNDLLSKPYEEARDEVLQKFKREYILRRLNEAGWNITHAAEKMGLRRQSLQKMIKELGLIPPARSANH